MFTSIIGHSDITNFFTKTLDKGYLSHAYCFSGRSRSGKRAVADAIAGHLLHVAPEKVSVHPDFVSVGRARDEKTNKLKKDISIKQIRSAIQFFSQSPYTKDGYKVLIIENAELMSVAASNALLKTLEEPRGKRIIFLLTEDDSRILPTIKSRCQKMHFGTVSDVEMRAYIESRGVTGEKVDTMITHAHGLPGVCTSWIDNPETYDDYMVEVERFKGLATKPLYEKLAAIDELFGDKTDHIATRENLINTLKIWHSNMLHVGLKLKPEEFVALDEKFRNARTMLTKNIHPRLLVEHIMLQLP